MTRKETDARKAARSKKILAKKVGVVYCYGKAFNRFSCKKQKVQEHLDKFKFQSTYCLELHSMQVAANIDFNLSPLLSKKRKQNQAISETKSEATKVEEIKS